MTGCRRTRHMPCRGPRRRRILRNVSEPAGTVRAEDNPSLAEVARRAEPGETISVIAHGQHVADIVPSGELDRLRETVEVLADPAARRALEDTEPVVFGRDAINTLIAERIEREQQP